MKVPSIKGTSFENGVWDLKALLEKGTITREELAKRLPPEDLKYLDEPIQPPLWYPMASFVRIAEVVCAVEANGHQAHYVELGRRNAERMAASGIYRQFLETYDRWGQDILRLLMSLGPSLYNFGEWRHESNPEERYDVIIFSGAEPMADPARLRALGFIQYLVEHSGYPHISKVTSERPRPDLILFKGHYSESR